LRPLRGGDPVAGGVGLDGVEGVEIPEGTDERGEDAALARLVGGAAPDEDAVRRSFSGEVGDPVELVVDALERGGRRALVARPGAVTTRPRDELDLIGPGVTRRDEERRGRLVRL